MLLTIAEVHAEQWTRTEHLLATVVDLLGQIHHAVLIAPYTDRQKVGRLKPPQPIDRPGQRRRRRGSTLAQLTQLGGTTKYVGEVSDDGSR